MYPFGGAHMSNFKVGDQVQLNSGGPGMTVSKVYAGGELGCTWFDANEKVQQQDFPAATLKSYKPASIEDLVGGLG